MVAFFREIQNKVLLFFVKLNWPLDFDDDDDVVLAADSINIMASLSDMPSSNWNSTSGKISNETKLCMKICKQLLQRFPPRLLNKGFVVEHLKLNQKD